MAEFQSQGFELIRAVFTESELESMRSEADRVAKEAGSICVRHLREKSERFDLLACSERLKELLPTGLAPVRSILFDKTPKENWPVPWHQDLTITVRERIDIDGYGPWSTKDGAVHVQPPETLLKEMATLRIHLDDTDESNGALRVIPKSHKRKIGSGEISSHVDTSEVVCECKAGDVLLMSPLILHASRRSQTPSHRRILHFEYAPLMALSHKLRWSEQMDS